MIAGFSEKYNCQLFVHNLFSNLLNALTDSHNLLSKTSLVVLSFNLRNLLIFKSNFHFINYDYILPLHRNLRTINNIDMVHNTLFNFLFNVD